MPRQILPEVMKARAGVQTSDLLALLWAKKLQGYSITTITGVPPLSFLADGRPLSAWSISGNAVQDGTPAPDDPIMPEFVGERTANLFEFGAFVSSITAIRGNGTFTAQNGELSITSNELQDAYTLPYGGSIDGVYKIPVSPNTQYSVRAESSNIQCVVFENGQAGTGQIHALNGGSTTFTTLSSTTFVTIRFGIYASLPLGTTGTVKNILLNTGSTAKPYEPYGYKLSITSAGQTMPIYLGQVQTVRRIKKLVLTGEETDGFVSTGRGYIRVRDGMQETIAPYSDKLLGVTTPASESPAFSVKQLHTNFTHVISAALLIKSDVEFTTFSNFQNWLRENAPVTVWYVLAETQTAIVNEPLAKIGDYADELHSEDAGITIQTVRGSNTLTVDTDLQPSSVAITGHIKQT